MKFVKATKIRATADDVWDLFAHQFDDADKWMASVPRSYGTDVGERFEGAKTTGRTCEFRPDGKGMKALERFVAYDEASRTGSIRVDFIDAPRMIPMRHLSLDFSVVDNADASATAHWEFGANIKSWAFLMQPMLKRGMSKAWRELAEELVHYVETGTPHPRKVAAIKKASLSANS